MSTPGAAPPAVRTVELCKRYGRTTAVDRLSIEVPTGSVYGFLGPNGAGKTTTVRMLLGLARPTAGRAEVLGHDVVTDRAAALARVAHVPGEFACWPTLRGSEMLDLLGSLRGRVDPRRRHELCQRFELDTTRRGREYSKGNRQKIALIAALMADVDLLVLDEPTSGLDPLMEMTFRECIIEARDRGQTVLLSSHVLSEVEAICDRVAILRGGRLVDDGTLDDLRAVHHREVRIVLAAGEPVPQLHDVHGVSSVVVDPSPDGDTVRLRLRSDPTALIAALAGRSVRSLDIREPSLEEMFLGFYGLDGHDGHDGHEPSLGER